MVLEKKIIFHSDPKVANSKLKVDVNSADYFLKTKG